MNIFFYLRMTLMTFDLKSICNLLICNSIRDPINYWIAINIVWEHFICVLITLVVILPTIPFDNDFPFDGSSLLE